MSSQLVYTLDHVFGCHLFGGKLDREGYGIVWRGRGHARRAHIVAYEQAHGAVPEDKPEVDHLCRRPQCIAPHHLEAVTRSENEKRKSWRYRARRQLCPKGHDLASNAIVTPEGGRICRACNREAQGATR